MSEFRIVKCKSCTAPLVELEGEKLTKCVQCGYDFSQKTRKKAKLEAIVEQAFENQQGHLDPDQQNSHNSRQTRNTPKPKTTNATTARKKTLSNNKKKNSGSIVGTIIKWYLIIFIASKVIQEFF